MFDFSNRNAWLKYVDTPEARVKTGLIVEAHKKGLSAAP